MSLRGVDISGWDEGIIIRDVEADFIIIKSTEGTQGTIYNKAYREMADEVLATGRLLGFYHYANGGDPIAEADCFYESIKDYKGRCVPCLDWEGAGNRLFESGEDVGWCRRFMDRISSKMGSSCLFYTSKTVCNEFDWSLCANYPLWGAEYPNYDDIYGYQDEPWQSRHPWGVWGAYPTIHQYTSTLVLWNNGGIPHFDGNIFYGSREDWERMCGAPKPKQADSRPLNDNGLWYQAHVQDLGWCDAVHDGQVAGTVGFGKRLEAIKFTRIPSGWKLRAKAHIANVGWKTFDVQEGTVIGTTGKGNAIEMLSFEVVSKPDNRRLKFCVHQQDNGWKGWTLDGFATGTDGMGLRLEAVKIAIG